MPRGNFGHDAMTSRSHYVVIRDGRVIADTLAPDAVTARVKLREWAGAGFPIYIRLGNERPLPAGYRTTTGEVVDAE